MPITASELRNNIYRLLDRVVEEGKPLVIKRKGRLLKIICEAPPSKLSLLVPHDCIQGDPDELIDRHMHLARETGTFLFYHIAASPVPGIAQTELHCWENALAFDLDALPSFIEELLSTP